MAINVSDVQWDDAPKMDGAASINPVEVKWDNAPVAPAPEAVRTVGSGIAPEQSAKILDIQKRTGLPPAFIERNLEPLKQKLIQADTREFAKLNPLTGAWLAESPYNTSIAQDDFENMGSMESLVTKAMLVPRALAAGATRFSPAVYGIAEEAAALLPESIGGGARDTFRTLRKGSESFTDILRGDRSGVGHYGQVALGGVESIGSQVPGVIASILSGNPAFSYGLMGAQTTGESFGKGLDKGISPYQNLPYGLSQGAIEWATEKAPALRLLKDVGAKSSLFKMIGNQLMAEIPGEQAATLLQDLNDWAVLSPDKTLSDYVAERPQAAVDTLLATIVATVGMGSIAHYAGKVTEGEESKSHRDTLLELGKLAELSKLRERAPEKFQEAMQRLFKGTKAENVYIPVEAWETYWQKQGVEPSVMAQEMGILPDAYIEAVANKGALQVATDAYIRKIGPTEHNAFFADEVKLRPEGMNAREFKAFVENPDAFIDPVQQITDEVSRQLVATGQFSEEDAKLQAEALYGAFFKTTGERAGVNPLELFRKYNLEIKSEGQKPPTTDAGNQMLDELRRLEAEKGQEELFQKDVVATDTPEFKAWFGDSKVVDENGKPLVVYHGTTSDIAAFKTGVASKRYTTLSEEDVISTGMFFSTNREDAVSYGEKVGEYYISAQNPLVNPAGLSLSSRSSEAEKAAVNKAWDDAEYIFEPVIYENQGRRYIDTNGGISRVEIDSVGDWVSKILQDDMVDWNILDNPVVVSRMKERGYDSVKVAETNDQSGMSWFVVDPTQIKSVFNRGTFDPNDPRILFQQKGKTPRGKITFGPKGVNIELLKNANPSTFIHETGHFWLKVLGDAVKLESASADLKTDYQTLMDWLGVKGDITTEQHEKFARGAEAYLREGKAPSVALRSAFARFKSWLTEVYKSLRSLNVELTPEVRDVFDRMLATQEEITTVQSEAENAVIDLVAEGRDAESVTDEEIARLVPAYKPQPASEVKGQVREATGLKRTFEYIREDKALEAAWKKAEQSARIAFKAGKAEEAAKWKEKMAEVVSKANEKVDKILTEKQKAARRRQSINTIVEYLGLTDAQVKKLTASKKDIRLMSDWEFKQFKDELLLKAVELQETNFAKARVAEVIERKHLKNSENYSTVLGYPSVNEMTAEQLHEWADILDMFADGDIFLTERKLELVDRTDLEGIRTWREVKEKLAEKAGVSIEDLNNIKVGHFDMLRWDNALADQNPFYGLLVEKVTKTMMNAEMRAHDIENRIFELAKKSEKSRNRGLVGRLIPQDKQIFDYLEASADEKGALAADMTPEQIDLAHYIQEYFAQALEYLIKTKSLEKGRENYFVHIRRSILENIKEDGLVKAMKEVYRNYQQDEMVFGILDDATGRILPNEKFFQFSMRRTGALDPTYNVVKAFLTYAKTFEKKVALDSILPELDLYAQALTPLHMTPRGLEIDRSLKDFVYKYINNKKGRQIGLDKVIPQGGPVDLALRGLRSFTTVLDLGFSIPVGLGTYVGEQAANLVMLGPKDMAKGTARIKTAKGKAILNKYESFVGRSMWQEFTAPGKEITDNIMTGLFGFFHSSTVLANKQYLLGSLTEQEYNSGEISPERLAQMKIDMGRFRVVPGTKSIFGSTSLGSALMQYKSWAAGILRTTLKDMSIMVKDLKNKPAGEALTTREAHEIYRIITITAAALIVFGMGDEDDKSFIGRLAYKVRSESLSMISALSPLFWTGYPRIWTFMKQLTGNVQALILMEEYKTKPGLKGLEGLKKQFTPGALRGINTEDKPVARR